MSYHRSNFKSTMGTESEMCKCSPTSCTLLLVGTGWDVFDGEIFSSTLLLVGTGRDVFDGKIFPKTLLLVGTE